MSDFEERVRSALSSASESAPLADGLAPAARGRLRKRRRTTFVAVAAALVVAAIPMGLAIASGGDRFRPGPSGGHRAVEWAPDDGWRWESYRDAELQVPDELGLRRRVRLVCRREEVDSVVPQVTRPGGAVRLESSVTLQYAYGVRFDSSAAVDLAHPSGSIWQYGDEGVLPRRRLALDRGRDEVAVTVVTRDQATASRIVDSVQTIDGVDGNGCAPRLDDRFEDGDRGRANQDSRMSICRYDDRRLVGPERATVRAGHRVGDGSAVGGTNASGAGSLLERATAMAPW